MSRPYIVGTGWWCDGTGEHAGSAQQNQHSSRFIRTRDFFRLWHAFVDHFTDPAKIIVVDSASPVQPPLPADERLEVIHLARNFGHAVTSEPAGLMSGVERCHLSLAAYAYLNDFDLVYIEQDCLVRGEGWVDHAFTRLRHDKIMYGRGTGTPQPMQQSVMLFRHEFLPSVISRATRAWARRLKRRRLDPLSTGRFGGSPEKRWHWIFRRDVDYLPFAGGRTRPLDFSQDHLYAQHWSEDELERYISSEDWLPGELADLVRKGT